MTGSCVASPPYLLASCYTALRSLHWRHSAHYAPGILVKLGASTRAPEGTSMWSTFWFDIRCALRSIVRQPVFTAEVSP